MPVQDISSCSDSPGKVSDSRSETGEGELGGRTLAEHSRFTALFERLAILVLKETSIEGAGKVLRISWDEA